MCESLFELLDMVPRLCHIMALCIEKVVSLRYYYLGGASQIDCASGLSR